MAQIVIPMAALVFSFFAVAGLRRWAEHRRILDIPNERSSHTRPIPRGGGLAIVFLSLFGFVLAWLISPTWPLWMLAAYLFGAVLISVVSWLDDLRPLPNRIRFSAHSAGAILVILVFGCWHSVDAPVVGKMYLGWLGSLVTFLWIVGLTNAYNFMDGIDGIAGGQAIIAGVGWAFIGWTNHQTLLGVLGLLLASTSLGFLGHNWPPARIFMGDVGSAFLGYTFAVLSVIGSQVDPRLALIGILLVWPFVFDTTFTFFRRLMRGENVFRAHRSHLYQRLVIAGRSHRFVTLLYMGLALVGIVFALIWYLSIPGSHVILFLTIPLLCFALWFIVILEEKRQLTKTQLSSLVDRLDS